MLSTIISDSICSRCDMITIFNIPQDQAELEQALESPEPKHVWHDVPANRWLIATGEDMPQAAAVE